MKQHWSKTGDGQDRVTTNSSRDVTMRADKGITITDTDSRERSVRGDGATGVLGCFSDATRVNDKPSGK